MSYTVSRIKIDERYFP